MAWTEPVTDQRVGGAYMTATDCNRITNNLRCSNNSAALPADVTGRTSSPIGWTRCWASSVGCALTLGVPVGRWMMGRVDVQQYPIT